MDSTTLFQYSLDNLSLYSPSLIGIIVGTIILLTLTILIHYILLYGEIVRILSIERKQFEKKKHILSDLILMKDIQTEMEAEIEKAMLKSTFQ
ncbi:MAG: hypothetical protein PHY14_02365 [Candidatus Gracilibacteria bacterium]|nr:hypothetical protein [Candidatus Gracilibacteria bacterium]